MATTKKTFTPLEAIHPSELVRDEMHARGLKNKDLAALLGMKAPNLSRFFSAREDITPSMAIRLEEALGISAEYWMRLQLSYERDLMAINRRNQDAEQVENTPLKSRGQRGHKGTTGRTVGIRI